MRLLRTLALEQARLWGLFLLLGLAMVGFVQAVDAMDSVGPEGAGLSGLPGFWQGTLVLCLSASVAMGSRSLIAFSEIASTRARAWLSAFAFDWAAALPSAGLAFALEAWSAPKDEFGGEVFGGSLTYPWTIAVSIPFLTAIYSLALQSRGLGFFAARATPPRRPVLYPLLTLAAVCALAGAFAVSVSTSLALLAAFGAVLLATGSRARASFTFRRRLAALAIASVPIVAFGRWGSPWLYWRTDGGSAAKLISTESLREFMKASRQVPSLSADEATLAARRLDVLCRTAPSDDFNLLSCEEDAPVSSGRPSIARFPALTAAPPEKLAEMWNLGSPSLRRVVLVAAAAQAPIGPGPLRQRLEAAARAPGPEGLGAAFALAQARPRRGAVFVRRERNRDAGGHP